MNNYRYRYITFWLLITLFIAIAGINEAEANQRSEKISYLNSTLWTGIIDVKVVGSYAYALYWNGLGIFDVTDPQKPLQISRIYLQGTGRGIYVLDNYAFIADGPG